MPGLIYMPGVCRICGCTDERACEGGCTWIEADLCSACVEELDADPDEDLDVDPFGL